MAKISIIVPAFNIEDYLPACLDSIYNQTMKDFELILVDDSSEDGCYDICESSKLRFGNIKVIHKKYNEGLVAARKTGLANATSEYILYVDGDDWIESNMVECMYKTIISENVDVVMCGRYEDTGNVSKRVYHGIPSGRYNKRELTEKVYPKMIVNDNFFEWGLFPGVWDKMFKKEHLLTYQNQVDDRITMGEDALCTYPCLLNVDSIYVLDECLYHYRQNPTSMVRKREDKYKERLKYQLLYTQGKELFEKYKDIYDMSEQWKKYLLFLMVPRSDSLYDEMEKLEYLFPYPDVQKGSSIIIYGAGLYGQRLYRYLKQSNYCNVVAVADKNWKNINVSDMQVINPEIINEYQYDFIVITCSFAKTRKSIYENMIKKYPKDKVKMMDEVLVMTDETMFRYGL